MPNWLETTEGNEKNIIKYSCFFTLIFKIIFSITFSNIINFKSIFNFSQYFNDDYSLYLKISLAVFFLMILINSIIIHTDLLLNYLSEYAGLTNSIGYSIAVLLPWSLSLFLINWQILTSILNWFFFILNYFRSSLFIFGFVNYILPLCLYICAVKSSINYERNYIDSAKLGFGVKLKKMFRIL